MKIAVAVLLALLGPLLALPANAQEVALLLQAGERALQIATPDGTTAYYACINTGMHPGQGQAGAGYDAVTYNVGVILQLTPGNDDNSQTTPNMEGIACRLMYQGTETFDVQCGAVFPPADVLMSRPPNSPRCLYLNP